MRVTEMVKEAYLENKVILFEENNTPFQKSRFTTIMNECLIHKSNVLAFNPSS